MTMGFLTLATGDDRYRRLAANLLRSYRLHTAAPLPFAILTDRENADTAAFDRVMLLREPKGNYLDKLALFDHLPFDTTIFIDADCLAFGDLNVLFDWFSRGDDVSCHGRVLPLTGKSGWFDYENLGALQSEVSYCVGLHGGIYYIRRAEKAAAVFRRARELAADYDRFRFRGNFPTPGDEPLMALAMALEGCRPEPYRKEGICCYWEWKDSLRMNIRRGRAVYGGGQRTLLVHFGTRFTGKLRYRLQAALLAFGRRNWHD